jgi:uncharacterized membrane protein
MKRILKTVLFYTITGLLAGVYFREMTKIYHFTGDTALSVVHTHIFSLGVLMLLLLALVANQFGHNLKEAKAGWKLYNIGLGITILMMLVRGTTQVLGTNLSSGVDHAIAGFAGIGHIVFSIGIILLFVKLIKWAPEK